MDQRSDFAAFVGIDWEQQTHSVCVLTSAGGRPQESELPQNSQAIAAWVAELRERFGGRLVAVCLEQSRGPLIYALMQYDFLVLFPINPKQLSDYRAAVYPSGAKSDPRDAELLARFLSEHTDKLRAWHPEDPCVRSLRLLTEQRRKWVQHRVALTNELGQRLRESYPLALELAGQNLCGERFLDLLEKFPSQRELQRASPKQLEKWLPKRRRAVDDPAPEVVLSERIAALRKAPPSTSDEPVLEHARLAIRHLVVIIRSLNRSIQEIDKKVEELFATHPDREVFASFPGAGKALAPRLLAAFGSDREKFKDASEIQQLSGIAPVTKASGKTKAVHLRWACPKFLRQTFHEFAGCSLQYSSWAKAFATMRKARGDRHQVILRALAFKWQRILYRCWKTRQPYDESRYLQRLRESGSELVRFLTPETEAIP